MKRPRQNHRAGEAPVVCASARAAHARKICAGDLPGPCVRAGNRGGNRENVSTLVLSVSRSSAAFFHAAAARSAPLSCGHKCVHHACVLPTCVPPLCVPPFFWLVCGRLFCLPLHVSGFFCRGNMLLHPPGSFFSFSLPFFYSFFYVVAHMG